MKYTKLGNSGLVVSRIALGCMNYGSKRWRPWMLEEDEARANFAYAIQHGVNFFDTSNIYSLGVSEQIVGRWVRELARREQVVIATKAGLPVSDGPNRAGVGRKHLIDSCEASLRRLRMDYVDLYQIHRLDLETPLEEMLGALDSLVRSGKVRYVGASSMAAWQFAKTLHTARAHGSHRPVAMQSHYNLVYREEEREMIPLCIDQGIGVTAWSPLARGFLTGNRERNGQTRDLRAADDTLAHDLYGEHDFDVLDAVKKVAADRGVSPAQVAVAWLLQAPGLTTPLIGADNVGQLAEAIAALEIKLSGEEVAALEAPYRRKAIAGHVQPTPASMMPGAASPTAALARESVKHSRRYMNRQFKPDS
ncbi:MAG TPA: aldo/keto reductase [Candidatus Binataceae bacterium]|jgi:aryl-alcohol dehydrogenase-like predicted oxidoreductase|nr:aldo/keto reductase [Candidatus Binataceae bacterium]